MGERTPLALLDAAASARMAVAEAITNIVAADIAHRHAAVRELDGRLRRARRGCRPVCAVNAVGEEFCPALGITIPVGEVRCR